MPGFLVDTNVWVAFVFPPHPGHMLALKALKVASAAQPAVLCRATELSFLRLLTTAAVFQTYGVAHMTNRLALDMLDLLLGLPHVVERDEPPSVMARWRQLAALPSPAPKTWMDAYLAAFALSAGLSLVTLDATSPGTRRCGCSESPRG